MKLRPDVTVDKRKTVFGTEYDVEKKICVCHAGFICRPQCGLAFLARILLHAYACSLTMTPATRAASQLGDNKSGREHQLNGQQQETPDMCDIMFVVPDTLVVSGWSLKI